MTHIFKKIKKSYSRLLLAMKVSSFAFMPNTFHAEFTQHFKSLVKGRKIEGRGVIDYQFPGHLRFESTAPEPFIFYSNRKESGYFQHSAFGDEPPTLEKNPDKGRKLKLASFFDILKKGLQSNKRYQVQKNKNNIVVLSFKPRVANVLRIKKAQLYPEKGKKIQSLSDVASFELHYSDGRTAKLQFKKFKKNVKHPKETFYFSPPKSTKIL